jgi:aspartyl-tRNA(Asn)/glutamyl-tRNA(Gln) amidotransferase subunit B
MASDALEKYRVKGYYPTIGIECHVQLKTKTKLFAPVSNEAREAEPNTLVSHICFGLPGALPVLNKEAVRLAARAAYALGTKPQAFSKFDRKHYFYPDLPKGYQISQYDQPIILGGSITITLDDGTEKEIAITRAHMEEDAGKSTHPEGADYSLVDLNRAGTPLLEIVSEPEIHSAEEAKAFAKELWLRMKYAGVSDVDLYHGNMRFDVNVSVSKDPSVFGTRTETKNLNSFRSVEKAVQYEIARQIEVLESGGEIVQETRGWLDDAQKTVSQRSKENAHDYRYFPDPDIPPIVLDEEYIAGVARELPTLPDEWRQKLTEAGLERGVIEELLLADAEDDKVSYLEALTLLEDPAMQKHYCNWVLNIFVPLQRETGAMQADLQKIKAVVSAVYGLLSDNKLSSNSAKSVLEECLVMPEPPADIEAYAEEKGYIQISDSGALEAIVDQVISDNPKPVADVQAGEMKAIGFLVGQIMKASQGKANPAEAQKILKQKLGV